MKKYKCPKCKKKELRDFDHPFLLLYWVVCDNCDFGGLKGFIWYQHIKYLLKPYLTD